MGAYIYCLEEDYPYKSAIQGREFENEWLCLTKDGTVTVKGSYKKGYAWDGCSPKIKFKDICIGIPDGVLNWATKKPKTYYASMIHDVFYQFSPNLQKIVRRKEVDLLFYNNLKENNFRLAGLYYGAVRLLGWMFWGGMRRR